MNPTYCRGCGILLASAKNGASWRGIEWNTMKKREQEAYQADKVVWVTKTHTIHFCVARAVKSALGDGEGK
jgi:hypothetical protein